MADVGTHSKPMANPLADPAPGSSAGPWADPSAELPSLDALFAAHLEGICLRTARALEACGYSALLVHSGPLLPVFQDDRTYPFEVHAPFKVWAPLLDVPDCLLYFEPGSRPVLIFHQPEDYWYKPPALPRGYWTPHFEIRPCRDREEARRLLPASLRSAAFLGDTLEEIASWGVGDINPPHLIRHLDFARAAKSPYELACLRQASRLGARGHLAAARAFGAGASEFEIELAFLAACGQREQELPYNPIIALNEGGAVLHYQVLEKTRPTERHSLLIDAGAEYAGYASDITRTYSHGSPDFSALIERMDRMQQSLCAGVKAGIDWREVHLQAHRLLAEVLREADIIRCGADEAIAAATTSVFLPHGIGHLLGLEVHDAGGFMRSPDGGDIPRPAGHPYLRLTRVLQEGFVVTMEPGLYFIPQLLAAARADKRSGHINWSRVDSLRKFGGIRIEDDLAVTATGCENLTRDAFTAERSRQ
ncbi:MAG TPA: Xaa-Pro dipeptidase [Steroidobacteraceae bacterium]|jgi:Xaa-Pro dipeptidase|nr:Xaa-Pro dipeptidase [Steroidobacteraceae bacterium]